MRPLLLSLGLLFVGCAAVGPRFSQSVATSFAQQPMRKLTTASAEIYYPQAHRQTAYRLAGRLEQCLGELRAKVFSKTQRPKVLLYLTSANFNNAYVVPTAVGTPIHSVIPLQWTSDLSNWFEPGIFDVSDVGCHELTHFVQLEQVNGLWFGVNWLFGNILAPNSFVESWFLEGLAQYYEGRLGRETGRPHSAFYRQSFLSGIASRGGELRAGDLNALQRELSPFGGNYLTGLHFVEYLADTHGPEKLWQLVDEQASAVVPPIAVTFRFRRVYGKDLRGLLDDYAATLRTLKALPRPGNQVVLDPDLGSVVRIAGARADGAIATVTVGRDEVTRLSIRERDGSVRWRVSLTEMLPTRRWITSGPGNATGLDFTADGRWLFLFNEDVSPTGEELGQIWRVDARTGEIEVLAEDLLGFGGTVRPDGSAYAFMEVSGDVTRLVELLLPSKERRVLHTFEPGELAATPAYAPDGQRIALARRVGHTYQLFLREPSGDLRPLTDGGHFNYAPRWLDEARLVFARQEEGRLQAWTVELTTGARTRVTDVPYTLIDPSPLGNGELVIGNREAWGWTLDRVALPPSPPAQAFVPADAPPTSAPDVAAVSDEPYRPLEGFFAPTLHAPFGYATPSVSNGRTVWTQTYGLSVEGQDRLAFHSWAANAVFHLPSRNHSFGAGYGNHQLAPWFLAARASYAREGVVRDWVGAVEASRSFWTTPVFFDWTVLDRAVDPRSGPRYRARLTGPGAAFVWSAQERTAYGGLQRGVIFSLGASLYPRAVGSSFDLADGVSELTLAPRLPLLQRHSFVATARARRLFGDPVGMMQLGGQQGVFFLTEPQEGIPGRTLRLPRIAFSEPVRGYEDFSVRASEALLTHLRYRYPFIIDRGTLATAWLLPSFFFRQIDVEGFFSGTYSDHPTVPRMRAAGGSVSARMAIGPVPFSLFYQGAARFDASLPPLHLLGFSLD